MPLVVKILAVATVLVVVAGCAPQRDQVVVDRLNAAKSPLVRDVFYRPGGFLDDAEIIVYLRAGVTDTQAREFWCQVVVPAGGTEFDSGPSAVTVWNDSGTVNMIPADTSCAAPSQ